MTVKPLFGKARKASRCGPFGQAEERESRSTLVLAGALSVAVAAGLTGTLAWLVMSPPFDSEPVALARQADSIVSETAAAMTSIAATAATMPGGAAPAAPTPVRQAASAVPAAAPAPSATPARAVQQSFETTAAVTSGADVLSAVAVQDPANPSPLAFAPENQVPAPSPAPRNATEAVNKAAEKKVEVASAAGSMGNAVVRRSVNMRAAARSGSKVLGVIPAKARVQANLPCKQWCLVTYNGQRGYIYEDFLSK